jgi:hypothetical protein
VAQELPQINANNCEIMPLGVLHVGRHFSFH